MSEVITDINSAISPTYYSSIFEVYQSLQSQIETLNKKIEKTIEKHESQFLIAYQNHIKKIKCELEEIRKHADQQQKQMKSNEKGYFMEKQIVMFREEALKLYDRLQKKTQETEIYRMKVKDLESTCFVNQREVRELSKKQKLNEAKMKTQQQRIVELQQSLRQIQNIEKPASILHFEQNTKPGSQANTKAITLEGTSFRGKKAKSISSKVIMEKKYTTPLSLGFSKKAIGFSNNYDSELKQWFVECVKSIKRDVAYRKNSHFQFDLNTVDSIEEFKMVDKLKLLEKFMENEKLLCWMYQKIFPSRISEVKEYLSANKERTNSENVNSSKTVDYQKINAQFLDLNEEGNYIPSPILPKMSSHGRNRRSQIRNKISIKEGKLNISHL